MRNKDNKNSANLNPTAKTSPRITAHTALAIALTAIFLTIAVIVIYRVINWGHFINLDEILKDNTGEYLDNFDSILPLTDKDGMPVYSDSDGKTTIVCFGNAPFADDRNSGSSLTDMIASMTGATVYNCSISQSYLASMPYEEDTADPANIFNFYWICRLASGNDVDQSYLSDLAALKDQAPAEAREVYDTVKSIDFSTVDVIAILYDASDYLTGHLVFNEDDRTDLSQFTGSLEAGLQLLKETYPHIRIIVMSPPYAYSDQLDENGNYISSELQFYSPANSGLYNYILSQCISCGRNTVTFLDLYSIITGANADQYLTDYLHLNKDGRKKVAERFVYALEYYYKDKELLKNHF